MQSNHSKYVITINDSTINRLKQVFIYFSYEKTSVLEEEYINALNQLNYGIIK